MPAVPYVSNATPVSAVIREPLVASSAGGSTRPTSGVMFPRGPGR